MDFLGIGGLEIIVVIVIALILFGPGKIVTFTRTMGRVVHNLKKISSELTAEVTKEIDAQEKKDPAERIPEDE